MDSLRTPLKFLSFYGSWEPINLNKFLKYSYKIYSKIIFLLIFLLFIATTIALIKASSVAEFSEIFIISVNLFFACFRKLFLIFNKTHLNNLINILVNYSNNLRNPKELARQEKYEFFIR